MAVTNLDVGRPILTAGADQILGRMYIKYIRYIGTAATGAGEEIVLNDGGGRELFRTIADGAEFIDVMPIWGIVDGVIVASITTGKIVIYQG